MPLTTVVNAIKAGVMTTGDVANSGERVGDFEAGLQPISQSTDQTIESISRLVPRRGLEPPRPDGH